MKRFILVSVMTAVLIGCKVDMPRHSQVAFNKCPQRPSDAQILAGLRFEANKHGLRWVVFCVPKNDFATQHYQADAEFLDTPIGAQFIEDGAKDSWAETGETPLNAAYALYLDLAYGSSPNMPAEHIPEPSDCNYQHVYDSDHDGKLPCSKPQP